MLAQLKRASRRAVALLWAMALVFALAPAVAMANVTGAGTFSRFFVHVHADGDAEHAHHGHHHHDQAHDEDADHHHHDPVTDGPDGDPGQPRVHVHFDVCCPSVLVPVQAILSRHDGVVGRVSISRVAPLQGAPPGLLLRPPIPSSLS